MYKILTICMLFLLSACTTDPVPEEDFEISIGSFPLLGTVPSRDSLPLPEDTKNQRKNLQYENDHATQKQNKIIKSIKA